MIICPNCSRENEDHYKFCLGCGTELSKADSINITPKPAEVARPGFSPDRISQPPRAVPTALPQATPKQAQAPQRASTPPQAQPAPLSSPPPRVAPESAPPGPRVVRVQAPASTPPSEIEDSTAERAQADPTPGTDVQHALPPEAETPPPDVEAQSNEAAPQAPVATGPDLPFDVSGDVPAEAMMATGTMEPQVLAPEPAIHDESIEGMPPLATPRPADGRICGSCGAAVPEGFKFCGVCGTRYDGDRPAPDVFVPHVQPRTASPARLVLVHPDGSEGEVFPLGTGETTIGRSHPSSIFAEDPFLSPRHATFYFVKGQLFIRDEGSLNGVFLRIKAEVELFHWDMFRAGQQLLRFEEMSQVRPVLPGAGDGTIVMGSPLRGGWGRLASVVALDTHASVWVLRKNEEMIGRERGDIQFAEDGFVSGQHSKLTTRDGRYFLQDLDSTNGTYLRIKGEGILARGDLLLLGQQLFKVEVD